MDDYVTVQNQHGNYPKETFEPYWENCREITILAIHGENGWFQLCLSTDFMQNHPGVCSTNPIPNLSSRPNVEVTPQVVARREARPTDQPDTPVVDATPTTSQPIDPTPNVDMGALPSDTLGLMWKFGGVYATSQATRDVYGSSRRKVPWAYFVVMKEGFSCGICATCLKHSC